MYNSELAKDMLISLQRDNSMEFPFLFPVVKYTKQYKSRENFLSPMPVEILQYLSKPD
jgi:hypothetical protein